jgi:serine/threonine protein kinase
MQCSPQEADLFVPLAAWFFLTLAAGLASVLHYVLYTRRALAASSAQSVAASATGWAAARGEGSGKRGITKQSWELGWRELRFGPRVGQGNVGEVFRGTFRGRDVALKRLLPRWAVDEDMVGRFREEINLMATMNHPNVLLFLGAVLDRDAGHVCLVTEFCNRGTLADVLRSSEPLPWRTRVHMAQQVARGMGYLHEKAHIIQRDLKTSNLLVTEQYEVKIADFGLSRELAPIMDTYCGTPATMAPEITRQAPYDARADVFSFGIIMWELLTRQEPYPGVGGLALALQVATQGMRPPVPASCPAEWAALMVRAWDANQDSRPSFDTIQRELGHMLVALDQAVASGGSSGEGGSVEDIVARKKRRMARRANADVLLIGHYRGS